MIIEGETILLEAEFKDEAGNLVSPPGVEIETKAPGQDTVVTSLTEQSAGVFTHEYQVGAIGVYWWLIRTGDGAKEQKKFIASRKRT